MLPICLTLVVMSMWLFPDTDIARFLHKYLVAKPERWIANAKREDVIYFAIVLIMCLAAGEMVSIFGSDFLLAYSWDLTLYVDGMIISLAAATVSRVRSVARFVARCLPVYFSRAHRRAGRAIRSRRQRTPSHSANEDDGGGLRLAA